MNTKSLETLKNDDFEKREQALDLRAKVMRAEEERLSGAKTMSVSEARKEFFRKYKIC